MDVGTIWQPRLDEETIEALEHILDYLWSDEAKGFSCDAPDEWDFGSDWCDPIPPDLQVQDKRCPRIFLSLVKVREWLDSEVYEEE
ncbi:MAG: hypothetical protein JW829_01015 [Pirellulales bacterium]|nr:hypothetical protein [Pirellulales bacterium]